MTILTRRILAPSPALSPFTTGILDNFNRANQGPPPSASWASGDPFGDSPGFQFKVASNQMIPASSPFDLSSNYWNTSFAQPAECYVTLVTIPVNNSDNHCILGFASSANSASYGLELTFDPFLNNQSSFYDLVMFGGGGFHDFSSNGAGALQSGDAWGFRVGGGTCKVFIRLSGTWSTVFNVASFTNTGSGLLVVEADTNTAWIFDDFGGGTSS